MKIQGKYVLSGQIDMVREEDILIVDLGDSVVVFEKFELNLLDKLSSERNIEEISVELLEQYHESYDEHDFYNFIAELLKLGIIVEKNEDL